MSATITQDRPRSSPPGVIRMDGRGRVAIPRGAAITSALIRVVLGLLYLWAFIVQGLGVTYTNKATPPADAPAGTKVTYEWTFGYDSNAGWISSGFQTSPTAKYVDNNLHGPLAIVAQKLPTGVDDVMWMFALGGLGIAMTLGIFSNIAGLGGFLLNVFIWLSTFPPSTNPIIDGEHVTFALCFLLLMWLQASNYWGLGRWWRARTPSLLH